MRKMLNANAKKWLLVAILGSSSAGLFFYFYYVQPRFNRYVKYYNNYDAYEHAREICAYPIKYLRSCPSNLVKLLEEKGYPVASEGKE